MVTVLPVGAEAALSRARRPLVYADSIEPELSRAVERIAGTKDRITRLLAQVRQAPLDGGGWREISSEAYAERRQVPKLSINESDPWEMIYEYAEQAYRTALKMLDIETAAAPICDLHGPMLRHPADPSDRGRWECPGDLVCKSAYWWIDGSHVRRGR